MTQERIDRFSPQGTPSTWDRTDRFMRHWFTPAVALLLFAVVMVQIGIAQGRKLGQLEAKRDALERLQEAGNLGTGPSSPASAPLRCTNGDPPKPWTVQDVESAYHYAAISLDTARRYAGSMPHKEAWALEAIAGFLHVAICRP